MVWLKHSHWVFPNGLYGHVNDWLTLYILHSALIMSLSKDFLWLPCIQAWIPYKWNHLSTSILATVSAFWFGITTATLNLEKASAITNTFSLPVIKGSIFVKSKQCKVPDESSVIGGEPYKRMNFLTGFRYGPILHFSYLFRIRWYTFLWQNVAQEINLGLKEERLLRFDFQVEFFEPTKSKLNPV